MSDAHNLVPDTKFAAAFKIVDESLLQGGIKADPEYWVDGHGNRPMNGYILFPVHFPEKILKFRIKEIGYGISFLSPMDPP